MITVTFIDHSGQETKVLTPIDQTLMQVAIDNDVNGIDADCGGACACSTCHVYVQSAWQDKLPAVTDMEEDMLDFANGRTQSSRLACQIELTAALDGLVVQTPQFQK